MSYRLKKCIGKQNTLCAIFGDFKRKLVEMQKFCKSASFLQYVSETTLPVRARTICHI